MKRLALTALASVAAIAAATPANAALFLAYSLDGVTINALTDTNPSASFATGFGSAGGFEFTVNAQGAPSLASPALTSNTISAQYDGAKTATLYLYVKQTDNTAYNGGILSTFTSQAKSGGAATVEMTSFFDATNNSSPTSFGGTVLSSASFSGLGTQALGSALTDPNLFATSIVYKMTFTAPGSFNSSAQLAAVPEPATWGMMLLGFGVVGSAMRRRSAKTIASFA